MDKKEFTSQLQNDRAAQNYFPTSSTTSAWQSWRICILPTLFRRSGVLLRED